jgi:SAM-dependent methyltransferase
VTASAPVEIFFDFGKASDDYGRHRQGFPDAFFARLRALGVGGPGARALDLGTGTGAVARGLALGGAAVTGLDPSPNMLAEGRRLDDEARVRVPRVVARAEATPFRDRAFDAVTAGQCWHWFDRARAAAEVRRVLVSGGRLVIAHFDWIPNPGNVVESTEHLIGQHSPGFAFAGGLGMYPAWLRDAAVAGFRDLETFSFDVDVPYTHAGWRGRIRASAWIGATLAPDAIAAFDADHAAMLARDFPDEPLAVPHRVWALVARAPA